VLADVGPQSPMLTRSATSDAKGRYELLVTDVGLPYRVEAKIPAHETRFRLGILPGARNVDLVFDRRYPAFVRCADAGSGQVFKLWNSVQLWSRGENELEFRRTDPTYYTTDPDGWSELWLTSREVDFLAWPAGPELASYAPYRIDNVSLPDEPLARVELVLRPGLGVVLELHQDAGPLPPGCDVLLLEQELLDTIDVRSGKFKSNLPKLLERRRVQFDPQGRAQVDGLAPGVYRFVSLPENLVFDPDEFQVDEDMPPVVLRWRQD
jgi:hypothetical protein